MVEKTWCDYWFDHEPTIWLLSCIQNQLSSNLTMNGEKSILQLFQIKVNGKTFASNVLIWMHSTLLVKFISISATY